jgi:hypothetical protein
MPPIPRRDDRDLLAEAESFWDDFASGFRKSAKGNLWRKWNGETLTIFRKPNGFGWCIAGPEGKTRFSKQRFDRQDAAMRDLWSEVECW